MDDFEWIDDDGSTMRVYNVDWTQQVWRWVPYVEVPAKAAHRRKYQRRR